MHLATFSHSDWRRVRHDGVPGGPETSARPKSQEQPHGTERGLSHSCSSGTNRPTKQGSVRPRRQRRLLGWRVGRNLFICIPRPNLEPRRLLHSPLPSRSHVGSKLVARCCSSSSHTAKWWGDHPLPPPRFNLSRAFGHAQFIYRTMPMVILARCNQLVVVGEVLVGLLWGLLIGSRRTEQRCSGAQPRPS